MAKDRNVPLPDDEAAIPEWLLALRKRSGLSQRAVATSVQVDQRDIRRWEKGSVPNGAQLIRLLSAYGVKLSVPPARELPRALNAEMADLRRSVQRLVEMQEDRELVRAIEAEDRVAAYNELVAALDAAARHDPAETLPVLSPGAAAMLAEIRQHLLGQFDELDERLNRLEAAQAPEGTLPIRKRKTG